jgi:hypothetical protein
MLTWDDDVTPTVTTPPSLAPKAPAAMPSSVAPQSTPSLATHVTTVQQDQPLVRPVQTGSRC